MKVALSEIVARLGREKLLRGDPPAALAALEIHGVTTDSRFVSAGTLFCAVRGNAGDGHAFLPSAEGAGAAAALVEELNPTLSIPQITITDSRRAAAFAAAEYFQDPWKELTMIGVTGTNGKTTTVAILRHILNKAQPAASVGTLGAIGPDGRKVPRSEGLTTPGAAQFAEIIRRLADEGIRSVAMEVSSHALHQDRIAAATFSAGIFTNLTRDHLDYHATLEAYREAKLRLVELIRPGGLIIVNADDPAWAGVHRSDTHRIRFGVQGEGEVQAENIRYRQGGVEWHLHTPSCTAEIRLPLFGTYNIYNALGAAAALWGLGWSSDKIAEGMADLPQVPGRLEAITAEGAPAILIDYAHTPDALERALLALRPLAEGKLIVLFGAGGDRDKGKRPELGRVAGENADFSIVTTDNPRHEDPLQIIAEIESGMGGAPRRVVVDRREAIGEAIAMATPKDLVLLAGKGHETYQIWGDERRPFDERLIVEEILNRKGSTS